MPPRRPTRSIARPVARPAAPGKRPVTSRFRRSPRREGGGGRSWVLWLVVSFVVLPLLGFGLRLCTKAQDDGDVLREAHAAVARIDGYDRHRAYYDGLVERCHPGAFEQAYRIGGRRQANSMDAKAYLRALVGGMRERAQADGESEVATALAEVLARMGG